MPTHGFRTKIFLAAAVVTAVSALLTPTAAANPVESPVTVSVIGGTLTISAPTSPANLGTRDNRTGGVLSGQLGQVKVDDSRGAGQGTGWVASVTSTDFATASGSTIPAAAVSYSPGSITRVGTANYTGHSVANLSNFAPAVTAIETAGHNSATWSPTIHVQIPPNAIAGVYNATITHSVA